MSIKNIVKSFKINDDSKQMFGPLSFEDNNVTSNSKEQICFLCDLKFAFPCQLNEFMKHIFETHNVVIEDFQNIERIHKYISFWFDKFQKSPIESLVPSVQIEGTNQKYFLLSALLKADKEIRHKLKLESALEQQEHERLICDYKRSCLICKLQFDGKLSDYVKHITNQHNLQLGKPENLVYTTELLDKIEQKINSLICIYCEKTFTDRNVLKEHMRKKLHKRINPSNRSYDKYYIVNYLEPDRNWQHLQNEDDSLPITLDNNPDDDWSDWNEKEQEFVCLFCDVSETSFSSICDHMKCAHCFDFLNVVNDLDFYQKVKLINYIRRQIHIRHCIKCDENLETKEQLQEHMKEKNHCMIPERRIFDQPEFYFPTYENDALLYYLEEICD